MKTRIRTLWWALLVLAALRVGTAAQEPPTLRRIVLPSLDSQVRARLMALDGRLEPIRTPDQAASLVGRFFGPAQDAGSVAFLLGDPRNRDRWDQLADDYYRMMLESGNALVAHADDPPFQGVAWTSGQVRRLCQQRLTLLPRASLELYRQRIDAEALALFKAGKESRSGAPMRKLVDELSCSSVSDLALDLLGDLAFERGDFEEARHWWRLLAPLGPPRPGEWRFPDPKADRARARAKGILACIFQGRLEDARLAVRQFEREHPHSTGLLAGQKGAYARILTQTLATFADKRLGNNDEPWMTFGGDAARNRCLSAAPAWHLFEDGPTWRVKLPTWFAITKQPVDRLPPARLFAFHPIIVAQQVLVADHRSVVSYHLLTGKELFRYDLKAAGLHDPGPILLNGVAATGPPRFTLSSDGERAYVRLGGQSVGSSDAQRKQTYLVCLDLTQPDVDKKRELWRLRADAEDTFFEGTPLSHDGRVYWAVSKVVARRTHTSIVCHDRFGRQSWTREVCATPEFEDAANGPRQRQHLLSCADGQIIYCSHSGAIVAVDAWTGQPTWGLRYPSRGPTVAEGEPSPRELAPCVCADGLVYAAPLDSDRLFCIDALTGRVRWELDGVEIVHLLGVAQGRVLTATREGLLAVDSATGQIEWSQPTEGGLRSAGRGLVAGSWLLWPTQDAKLPYRAVTLSAGRQQRDDSPGVVPEPAFFEPTMLQHMPVGNLAFGHGCLAIAGQGELAMYVPANRQPMFPGELRPQARASKSAPPGFRLGSE